MARLFADENFPLPTVKALRELGHDVVTLQEQGGGGDGLSDPMVLTVASKDHRALLTINRKDFFRLHHMQPDHGGIIACTLDLNFANQAARIHQALAEESGELAGKLLRVNRPHR